MKQLKILLLLLSIALYSAGQGVPKGKIKNGAFKGNSTLLVYTGSLSSPTINFGITINLKIDSSIGLKYEVYFKKGSNTLSHMAIFYKFSTPNHSVYYNYLSHKSEVLTSKGDASSEGPTVNVLGTGILRGYNCTHLQYKDDKETQDYWMSKQVPGFQKLMSALKAIGPDYPGMAINGTVFLWGGAVSFTSKFADDGGRTANVNLTLTEANSNMFFPASDFDVPSN